MIAKTMCAVGLAASLSLLPSESGPAIGSPDRAPHPTGLVDWHEGGFDAAIDTARESGRPVFLFQLLGRLDEEFR